MKVICASVRSEVEPLLPDGGEEGVTPLPPELEEPDEPEPEELDPDELEEPDEPEPVEPEPDEPEPVEPEPDEPDELDEPEPDEPEPGSEPEEPDDPLDDPLPLLDEPPAELPELPELPLEAPEPSPELLEPAPELPLDVPEVPPDWEELPVLPLDAGAPWPSVRISSTLIWESTWIVSLREPALITMAVTPDASNVALTPSTVATIEFPLFVRATLMALAWPVVPVQVRTPPTRVGVTVNMSRDSSASSPLKGAVGLGERRRRFFDVGSGAALVETCLGAEARNPRVRFTRAINSPFSREKPIGKSGALGTTRSDSRNNLTTQIFECPCDRKPKIGEK